jgi:HK97 family phage portal protein
MDFKFNWNFPFVHRIDFDREILQRASINYPGATLEDWYSTFGWDTKTSSGVAVDHETAYTHSAVFRAIFLLSSLVGILPINKYRRVSNGNLEKINDRTTRLLREPSYVQTGQIFRETVHNRVLTWGNGYARIIRNGAFEPIELRILDSSKVNMRETDGQFFYEITGGERLAPEYILHIPALTTDGYVGKSPIQIAKESIGGGLALQKYGNEFIANGSKQSGILMHPMTLGDKGIQNLRQSFNKNLKDKSGGVMILEEGMKYQNITIPPDQAQFLASRKFSVTEIARWFGIPPHFLSDLDRATFSNIEHQSVEFVVYSLMPWLKRWEEELNKKFLTEDEKDDFFYKFNVNALLRGDQKSRYEAYKSALQMSWMNINEVRELEEMNKIEGGDKFFIDMNRQELSKIGKNGQPDSKKAAQIIQETINTTIA